MLKGLDPLLPPDLLHALAAMGHGDELALVDRNYPATSTSQRLIRLDGADTAAAVRAILSLLPLDTFVDEPLLRMEVVGSPDEVTPVQRELAEHRLRARRPRGRDGVARAVSPSTSGRAARSRPSSPARTRRTPASCSSKESSHDRARDRAPRHRTSRGGSRPTASTPSPRASARARLRELFLPWFASNVGVFGISYGAFCLAYGLSVAQSVDRRRDRPAPVLRRRRHRRDGGPARLGADDGPLAAPPSGCAATACRPRSRGC